jgi:hypothetical protein
MDAVALAFPILVGLIVVALAFDFLNGLHDAANSIATVVSTRVMRPQHAVLWAAFFNFVAFLIFGSHVAQTVGTGIVAANVVDAHVVFGALMGAIIWNVITWALGIPSSSSHALIGGLVGAGTAKAGIKVIVWDGLAKTTAAIVLSPLCGFVLAMLLFLIVTWIFVRYTPFAVDRTFRRLQLVSASLYSIGQDHGHHHGAVVLARVSQRRISRAVLGHALMLRHDGRRHHDRRLAHRAHDGIADYTAAAVSRILRRDRRCHHAVRCHLARHSGFHDAHDYRLHRRRRRGAPGVVGALERCQQHRHRLDRDHPGVGHHRRIFLSGGELADLMPVRCVRRRSPVVARQKKLDRHLAQEIFDFGAQVGGRGLDGFGGAQNGFR